MSLQALAERVMPRTEEGEFELVLGNKQLLSVFFIVVVLLGVFFTMGYIVGRNTAEQAIARMSAAPGQPLVVESEAAGSQAAAPPPGPSSTPAPAPAAPRSQPAPAVPTEAMIPPTPAPAARPEPRITPAPPPAPTSSAGVSEPPSGTTWLQVAATSKPEVEVLRDVLIKRGFSVQLAPVPDQDLVRVLVGPVAGEEVAQTRNQLQDAGFKPFARRY